MERIISEGELRDLIGQVVVDLAGSPEGTVVTNEVKVIMNLIKKYSKEEELVSVIDGIKDMVEGTEEQIIGMDTDIDIARSHNQALIDIYGIVQDALLRLKV